MRGSKCVGLEGDKRYRFIDIHDTYLKLRALIHPVTQKSARKGHDATVIPSLQPTKDQMLNVIWRSNILD